MHISLLFIALCSLFHFAVSKRVAHPVLPALDYVIYTTIIDNLSKCDDKSYVYSHNKLLFIKPVTKTLDNHSFRFNYIRNEQNLAFSLHSQATFYKEPAWKMFIASIDTTQFGRYEIKNQLTLKCHKTKTWSPEMDDYYFGKETARYRDYYALRKDYEDFWGIISFSKVVYSTDQTKALCYYSKVSDGRAGAGYIVFLERKEENWKVVGATELWGA